MKSITIHNLNDSLETLIQEKAKKYGTSLNKTIQMLLEQALGLTSNKDKDHRNDFMDIFAVWSIDDENEFNKKTKNLAEINKNDWK